MKTQTINFNQGTFQFNEEKGIIKIEGRFISLYTGYYWDQIISNAERIAANTEKLRIDFTIEYISSCDIKYLFILMKSILKAKKQHSRLVVNWKYKPFDKDHLELGRIIKDSIPDTIKFHFIEQWDKKVA